MDNIGFADYNLLDQTVRILKPDPEYRKSIAFDGKGKHVHLPDNLSFIGIDIALLAEYRCRIYISKFPVAIDRPPHSMPAQHLYYPQRSFCSGGTADCHHSHNVQVIESTFNQNDVGIRLINTQATISILQALQPTENVDFWMYIWLPDLPIDGTSRAFYIWPHVIMSETEETFNLLGRWFTIYEDSADLVGSVKEIPTSALPGETINVQYTIQNRGRGQAEGSQTVQFYLSKKWGNDQPPQPNYPLLLPIQLSSVEGEWTSQLTLPTDVQLWIWGFNRRGNISTDNTLPIGMDGMSRASWLVPESIGIIYIQRTPIRPSSW